jgi:predicted XRE-type DNA-binding protein
MNLTKKIESKTEYIPFSGCHIWMGNLSEKGYGLFINNRKTIRVHRYIYEIEKGSIPPGMYVCHTCDVPSCINPNHLFVGTPADNSLDMKNKNRWKREKNPGAKISQEIAENIRGCYETGEYTQRELGIMFHLNNSTISDIVNHKIWRNKNARQERPNTEE